VSAARRLEGLGVVLTRPLAAAEALAATLSREGANPFVFPALAIEDMVPSAAAEEALCGLAQCALAIFVSANAVEKGLAAARARGAWPAATRVAAIGEATALALRNSGFESVISPRERHDSEALLALAEMRALKGCKVIVFRGEGGRERLREVLASRGAHVDYVECYRRVRPRTDPSALLAAWRQGKIHAVSALSAQTLENFLAMVGDAGLAAAAATTLVVPHEAIAAHPDGRRFARVVVASPGAEGLVNALCQLRVTTTP
jgi:uroporphyrinogen-III synthase